LNKSLDQLEVKKNEVFVAPAIGIVYTTAYEASAWGITKEVAEHRGMFASLERSCEVYKKMRKRGIRVLPSTRTGPRGDLRDVLSVQGFVPSR
jgi:hypothetical protein